jgi:hypothetical protein
MTNWQSYRESLSITLARTVGIALVAGGVLAHSWGGLGRWPLTTALMLWPSFGGHSLELWFLNWLRPRLPDPQRVQIAVRLAVWFIGGVGLAFGMRLTAMAFTGRWPAPWATWWMAGFAFIGIELVAHLVLQLRRRPSFFNGRG